jgi:hypothetical protein
MIKLYLITAFTFLLGLSVSAQLNSDHPSFHNSGKKTTQQKPSSPIIAKALTVSGTIAPCDSGVATLVGTGACEYIWSTDSAGTNVVATNDTLITGMLYGDTTLYVSVIETTGGDSLMGLPNHSSVFTGNVRGYYFIAPTDFVITGLRVPTEASTGPQNVAVLLFDNNTPPPVFSGTTNAFQTLGYWNNYTGPDTISVCFPVDSGQVIGIYGNRNDAHSYAAGPYNTMINGIPTTLTRSGMQLDLSSNPMSNVFSETAGSISRVEMHYSTNLDTTVNAVNVVVPAPSATSASVAACLGETLNVNGISYTSDTTVVDSLFNIGSCDSIVTTTIAFTPSYNIINSVVLCDGDSVDLNGTMYGSSGIVIDSLQTVSGCDSTMITVIQMIPLPTVTLDPFGIDSVCTSTSAFALPTGSPAGGSYSGPGLAGNDFDPAAAGPGTHTIEYAYSDSNGCGGTASSSIVVVACMGINDLNESFVTIYPNPTQDNLTINFPGKTLESLELTDALGRTIASYASVTDQIKINLSSYATGVYYVTIRNGGYVQTQKVIKK